MSENYVYLQHRLHSSQVKFELNESRYLFTKDCANTSKRDVKEHRTAPECPLALNIIILVKE